MNKSLCESTQRWEKSRKEFERDDLPSAFAVCKLVAYKFHSCSCCKICLALKDCLLSIDNPELLQLAAFMNDDCRSYVSAINKRQTEREGGFDKVKEGDEKLHRLLTQNR